MDERETPLGAVIHQMPPHAYVTREGIEKLRQLGASDDLLRAAERSLRRRQHRTFWQRFRDGFWFR